MRSASRLLDAFHPAVAAGFAQRFPALPAAQAAVWPMIDAMLTGAKVLPPSNPRVRYRDVGSIASLVSGKSAPVIVLPAAQMRHAKHARRRQAPAPTTLPATTAR